MEGRYVVEPKEQDRICGYYGRHLRKIRKRLGFRQSDFADALGTTQKHISQIETGKAQITWTMVLAISYVFAFSPKEGADWLEAEEESVIYEQSEKRKTTV